MERISHLIDRPKFAELCSKIFRINTKFDNDQKINNLNLMTYFMNLFIENSIKGGKGG